MYYIYTQSHPVRSNNLHASKTKVENVAQEASTATLVVIG